MADEIDRASEIETAERDARVAAARGRPSMPAVGACYNCGEEIGRGLVFCDIDCRDDFQKRNPGQ
ncbi:MAG: hypothetical protein ROZ09_11480 [Thiobacillus sp.]|uniref:hypothetical protein n=1 Tax=Thiobacillus sp. TaxID=924 RepID=UPI002894FF5F|nr:hypothetical protein [Thiobacillus sp.]MDT3707440.1 hypothetical protein [Thiobacillus sp.]